MAFFSSMVWSRRFMHTIFFIYSSDFCVFSLLNATRSYQSRVAVCVCVRAAFETIKTIAARINNRQASRCCVYLHIVAFSFWCCRCRMHIAYAARIQSVQHKIAQEQSLPLCGARVIVYEWDEDDALVAVAVVVVVIRRRRHRRRAPFSWNSGR